MIKVNTIQCHNCKQIIWSTHTHDFHQCSCQRVAIDGGQDYTRIIGEGWDERPYNVPDHIFPNGCFSEDDLDKGDIVEVFDES